MSDCVRGGSALRNAGNMLLRGTKNVPADIRFANGDGKFARSLRTLLQRYDDGDFRPLVRNPRAVHYGLNECAADACMQEEGCEGGFGLVVGSKYAYGLWPEAIRRAWSEGLLSISPLEYVIGLMAMHLLLEHGDAEGLPRREEGMWLIARSDNMAACHVSRRHLSTRPVMAECVDIQMELEERHGVSLLFDHIPGKQNLIAEKLSRGQIDGAIRLMKAKGIRRPERVQLGAVWDGWLERVLEVVGTMKEPEGVWDEEELARLRGLDGELEEEQEEDWLAGGLPVPLGSPLAKMQREPGSGAESSFV